MASNRTTPKHRRMSWQQDAARYRIHRAAPATRKEYPVDPDVAGYAYAPRFKPQWEVSPEIRSQMNPRIAKYLDDWAAAGAAVLTSNDRIGKLDAQKMDRGWSKKRSIRSSRSTSDASQALGLISPPSSFTMSPPNGSFSYDNDTDSLKLPALLTDTEKQASGADLSKLNTPPYTPHDHAAVPLPGTFPVEMDVDEAMEITDQFTEYTTMPPATGIASPPTESADPDAPFNLQTWELFVNEYRNELYGIQKDDMPRMAHLRILIIELIDIADDKKQLIMPPDLRKPFDEWWARVGQKEAELKDRVYKLTLPDLDEVKRLRELYLESV